MLTVIEGKRGAGKSTFSTFIAVEYDKRNIKTYANYSIYLPSTEYLEADVLERDDLENFCLVLDEVYLYADCRNSMSKLNKKIAGFIAQSRKKTCYAYFVSQFMEDIDKRLRKSCDMVLSISGLTKENDRYIWKYRENQHLEYCFLLKNDFGLCTKTVLPFNPKPYFKYFNTKESIEPFE